MSVELVGCVCVCACVRTCVCACVEALSFCMLTFQPLQWELYNATAEYVSLDGVCLLNNWLFS